MSKLTFDYYVFGDKMLARSDLHFENGDKSNHGWTQENKRAMHYGPKAHGDYYYRTWFQDLSLCRNGGAILVSCKIDQRRGDFKHDDHLVLLASVARDSTTITVQAAMQSIKRGVSGQTGIIVHKDGVDTSVAIRDAVTAGIDKMMKDNNKSPDGPYSYLATIAQINLQCLAAACVMK